MGSEDLFTGERFVPGINDRKLEIEHYQRYLSVQSLVVDKVVLDVACGEGYGSNILAQSANMVTGIDICKDAINRAIHKYGNRKNLKFQQGNIQKLQIPDNSIDVIVSFETIEHVPEETQEKFLQEIDRVLKKDGVLIMSTPNKKIYSDMHSYKNEFHVKEFYYDEFINFLHEKFEFIKLYNQAFRVLSIIDACDRTDRNIYYYSREKEYSEEGKYYIAVASHDKIAEVSISSIYIDNTNEYEENIERILRLQKEEEARNKHIDKLNAELEQKGESIRKLQEENSDRNNHIAYLDSVIERNGKLLEEQKKINSFNLEQLMERSQRIAEQTERLINLSDDFNEWQKEDLRSHMLCEENYRQHIADLEQTVRNKEGHIELLLESERKYEREKKDLESKNLDLENQNQNLIDEKAELAQTILNKEGHIELLLESERKYEHEKKDLESKNLDLEDRNLNLKSKNLDLETNNLEIENRNVELESRNLDLENQILDLEEENQNLKYENEGLEQIVRNKEGHIEQLLEVERKYEHEKTTHGYKIGKKVQKVGNFLLPLDSRRRFFLRILFNIFRHPILMLHLINPSRIKNYLKYMKLEGMEGVKKRYAEAVDIERMKMNPESRMDLDLEDIRAASDGQGQNIEDFEKLEFPKVKAPAISIIIPVYNEFAYTYGCLKSILKNSGDMPYEIIIADDCSTDLTRDIRQVAENIRVITTKKNLRFLLNCNNAANHAKGKYILFLNNDTQVQENWLEPLVTLMESDEKIGMVGSKLVYPDGLLQEAGGIVWSDASAWNYGNRKSPEDPEYNYVKEADYISGASIMIRKALWKEIGGFDERYVPAYYEDTDLAFEVRKHGYKVMYQPLSIVVHYEGTSNGTDVEKGLKLYQQVNFHKFYDKWKNELNQHEANAQNVFTAKDRSGHKKHMLVVDHYVPHHDQDAGGKCTYMYLKLFVKMGFQVTFIGDNFYKHEPYTTDLNQMGIEVLYGNYYYNNWQEWLKENCHYFDYIYLQRPHIAVKYMDLVKEYSNAKVFYFAHDLHHIREYREYEMTKDPEKLKSSENWKKIEYDLFGKADVGHVVGSYEQEIMQKAFPDKPIRNIPLYIYDNILTDINKDFSTRQDLLYVGGFGHPPNIDAVLWFAKEIFPEILKKNPDIKWHVVGGKVPVDVQALASDNIIIEGFLSDEDLEKLYRTCRMSVVPLRFGAGVKGKVVESAYFQIPLVTTSIGAEGLNIENDSMIVEDDAAKMAELICDLYENFDKLSQMSDNGRKFISKYFMISEAERVIRLDVDI